MFLALRDLRFGRTRFVLMGAVISLIAVLMVLLSGLSQGLVKDGVSGLQNLPITSFAFEKGVQHDSAFTRSVLDQDAVEAWRGQRDVNDAAPFGLALVNGANQDGVEVDLALIGVEPETFIAPRSASGDEFGAADGLVVSSHLIEKEKVKIGDTITLEHSGLSVRIVGVMEDQNTFGHVDMAYVPLDTWRLAKAGVSSADELTPRQQREITAVAVDGPEETAAADRAAGTESLSQRDSYNASPGYTAETSTLMMIQVFLYAICALVAGAFFTVLTIHRKGEIAVLRAMGASTGYLLRDGLGQALLLLLGAVGVGVGIGVGFGALLQGTAMPFALVAGPVVLAALLLILLGLAGAAAAIVRITRVDPLTALGANR
ncbi:FtsX-like permease family protein [Nocardioides sp. Bht2]|uniref:ABC transporter permease n=1 Tax=Nocardioides sp. Bht2 TaxID=3392297 RepID=UPI0039B4A2EF